jgi:hypothetical protein
MNNPIVDTGFYLQRVPFSWWGKRISSGTRKDWNTFFKNLQLVLRNNQSTP